MVCGPRLIAERARAVDSAAIRAIVVRWLAPSEVWMPNYVGLGVSQKTTSICVVDEQGHRLWRGVCTAHPDPIATRVLRHAGGQAKLGSRPASAPTPERSENLARDVRQLWENARAMMKKLDTTPPR